MSSGCALSLASEADSAGLPIQVRLGTRDSAWVLLAFLLQRAPTVHPALGLVLVWANGP